MNVGATLAVARNLTELSGSDKHLPRWDISGDHKGRPYG